MKPKPRILHMMKIADKSYQKMTIKHNPIFCYTHIHNLSHKKQSSNILTRKYKRPKTKLNNFSNPTFCTNKHISMNSITICSKTKNRKPRKLMNISMKPICPINTMKHILNIHFLIFSNTNNVNKQYTSSNYVTTSSCFTSIII